MAGGVLISFRWGGSVVGDVVLISFRSFFSMGR